MDETIKMMDPPNECGHYDEDIHRCTPHYAYGKDMRDYVTNSIYDEWCKWEFPTGIKEQIEDDKLYLVWYHYKDSSNPQSCACKYTVYYIEKTPNYIQEIFEKKIKYEKSLKKYCIKYKI